MTATRLSHGLAVSPDRDLAMFAEMAAAGRHLSGPALAGHGWAFEDGDPEDVVFDIAYEKNAPADYADLFAAAGWTRVLSLGDAHLFKAPAGTAPVHSRESRREELQGLQSSFLRASVVSVLVLLVLGLVLRRVSWAAPVEYGLLVLCLVAVVYTVVPLAGFSLPLSRLPAGRSF